MCILESERLSLRPPRPADIEAMAVWLSDYDVAKMTSRVPHPYGEQHAEEFLVMPPDGRHVFVIERKDGLFIGMTGLRPEVDGIEIGYWLGKPFWGFGYATEAAQRLVAYAFETLGVAEVHAGWFADNPASGQVLCKAGFLYTGDVEPRASVARGRDDVPTRMMVWLA